MALVAMALPSTAAGKAYTPPPKKQYFGVSDTGIVNGFKKFRGDVKSHPAVLQTFHTWGFHPWKAMNRWARTNTRGMLSIGTSECYDCPGVLSPKQIANGYGDEYPLTLARRLHAEQETAYIRLFPEMNGHWNDYSAYNQDGSFRGEARSTHWFRQAWRRFSILMDGGKRHKVNKRLRRHGMPKVMRAHRARRYRRTGVDKHLPKARVALMWVPQSTGSPDNSGNQPSDYWPGSKWVDWVGVDIYAKYPNFAGMERIYRAYKGKPFVIGEWSPWDYDSPGFVHQLFGFAKPPQPRSADRLLPGLRGLRPAPDLALPLGREGPAPGAQPQRDQAVRARLEAPEAGGVRRRAEHADARRPASSCRRAERRSVRLRVAAIRSRSAARPSASAAVDLRVAPAAELADLAVGEPGRLERDGAALGRVQVGESAAARAIALAALGRLGGLGASGAPGARAPPAASARASGAQRVPRYV